MPRPVHVTSPLDTDLGPIGVPDLETAAAVLDVHVADVERASRKVTPWIHADGVTRYWSVAQLHRQVAKDRARQPLTREQALASRELAGRIGIKKAAKTYGRSVRTLYSTWRKYEIPPLTGRLNRGGRRSAAFTRDQAEEMVVFLAEHGPNATAEKYDTTRSTLYRTLAKFKIPPPVGKGGPGIPRPKERAA